MGRFFDRHNSKRHRWEPGEAITRNPLATGTQSSAWRLLSAAPIAPSCVVVVGGVLGAHTMVFNHNLVTVMRYQGQSSLFVDRFALAACWPAQGNLRAALEFCPHLLVVHCLCVGLLGGVQGVFHLWVPLQGAKRPRWQVTRASRSGWQPGCWLGPSALH